MTQINRPKIMWMAWSVVLVCKEKLWALQIAPIMSRRQLGERVAGVVPKGCNWMQVPIILRCLRDGSSSVPVGVIHLCLP